MDLFEAMRNRRSVRKYADRPVPEELLQQLLEAARSAPSWANTQCTRLVVVRDPEIRRQLAETVPDGNPGRKAVGKAPVVIGAAFAKRISGFFDGKPSTSLGDWGMFDLGLALSQLTLTAHALGLGTVHVGWLDLEAAGRVLGLPADLQLVELIPLGYPEVVPSKAPPRHPIEAFTRRERWTE